MKKPILLDGAMGTELNNRGIDTPLPLWSADANLKNTEVVRDIHKDYIRAGSKIIVTNTFRTTVWTYKKAGFSDKQSKELSRASLYSAVDSAHKAARDRVKIAGSITSIDDCYLPENFPGIPVAEETYGYLIEWLNDAGIDIILFETMGNINEIKCALNIAEAYKCPKWLSIIMKNQHSILDGTPLKSFFKDISSYQLECLLTNCNNLDTTIQNIRQLKIGWDGLVGAYPNLGLMNYQNNYNKTMDYSNFTSGLMELLNMNLDYIGLCCGSTPEYISRLNKLIQNNKVIEL